MSRSAPEWPWKKRAIEGENFELRSPMIPHDGMAPHSNSLGVSHNFFAAFPSTASCASFSNNGDLPRGPRTMPPPDSMIKLDTPS